MRQAVAAALERLATRIEFNDGFELDLITPETWLAERHARAVIEGWRRDDVEIVELRLGADGDVLEPSRRLVEALTPRAGRRVLVLHVIDDGVDVTCWQLVFRRFNENRNAIVREFVGNLVLLLAPRLVQSFAAEAPDMWSIGATLVVGTRTQEQLLEAMVEHVHALLRLTREAYADTVSRARTVDRLWADALSMTSAAVRAQQLFEVLLDYDREQLLTIDTRPDLAPCTLRITRRHRFSRRVRIRPFTWGWSLDEGDDNATITHFPLEALDNIEQLVALSQSGSAGHLHVGLVGPISSNDIRLINLRRCVDLVLVSQPAVQATVMLGDMHLAPMVEMGALGATHEIVIHFEARQHGHVAFRGWASWESDSKQLWLPPIDPEDFGVLHFDLLPQPHH